MGGLVFFGIYFLEIIRWSQFFLRLVIWCWRHVWAKKSRSSDSSKNFERFWKKSLEQKIWSWTNLVWISASKILKKYYFWWENLSLSASRNFSMHPMTIFKVFRRCAWSCSLQWKQNHDHTTQCSKDIAGKPSKA